MSIWNRMVGWFTESSTRYVMRPIPKAGVEPAYDDTPAEADRAYLRIWLVEMRLAKSRNWFKDYQPAVHGLARLRYADQQVELARVAAPDKAKFVGDEAVLRNYPLVDLMPFRGGTVELDAALIAVKGGDNLGKAISAVAGFASIVSAPLAGALAVATKIKESADLLFDQDGEVQLAYHNTLGGAGGANKLAPGYIAIVLVEADKFKDEVLSVRNDELCIGTGGAARPLTGYDHMLLRIEAVRARDDLQHFTAIAKLRDKAIEAFVNGSNDEGENAFRAALAQVAVHPDLINTDKRSLIAAIREDVEAYRTTAHGAGPVPRGEPDPWAERVKAMRLSDDRAPITSDEMDTWMKKN